MAPATLEECCDLQAFGRKALKAEVAASRSQRFDGTRFAYLHLDATYVKRRVDGRSSSQAVVTAIGVDETGCKRFVGVDCIDTESHADWKAFLGDLRARGVESGREGGRLVVSDEHAGLVRAVEETFQGAAHQRRIAHLMRNVSGHIRKKADQKRAREALKAVFAQKSALMVRACYQQATEEVLKMSRAAGGVLLEAEDDALAYLSFRGRTGPRSGPTTCRSAPTARSSGARASCSRSLPAPRSSAWSRPRSPKRTRSGRPAA